MAHAAAKNAAVTTVQQLGVIDQLATGDESLQLLVQSAKTGQIDPWNVDIVALTEAYLATVSEKTRQLSQNILLETEKADKQVLVLTGKTLLYLAILLRMKSDLLSGLDPFAPVIEDAEFGDAEGGFDDPAPDYEWIGTQASSSAKVISLDEVLQRRRSAKQPRIRPVTLDDLIRELKRYEVIEQERQNKAVIERHIHSRQRVRDLSKLTTEAITELAHDEDLETTTEAIARYLGQIWRETPDAHLSVSQVAEAVNTDRVEAFLSFLFLEAAASAHIVLPEAFESGQISHTSTSAEAFYRTECWVQAPLDNAANTTDSALDLDEETNDRKANKSTKKQNAA
ncbi:MAG: hypothetical protein VKJ06_03330 [Vampirovibrionales bacterium]|nr:hypothetical protein [Vampirovibrionales bacterium]